MNAATSLTPGDRILLRERPWRVSSVVAVGDGQTLIQAAAADGQEPARLTAAVPPEQPIPLPSEEVQLDRAGLEAFGAWAAAHRLIGATLVRETGVLSGARFGRVALEAYQLAPTLRLLAKPRPNLLIGDDVGLGKTIEAGLAILELAARGRASRVLVVAPPGLMDQWHDELLDKFGLRFTIVESAAGVEREQSELPAGASPWDVLPRVITSIDYLKKEPVRSRALRKRWDLVIVDEAHALAESGTAMHPYRTHRTRLGEALRDQSRGLLLLTATPHNGYSHSFRSLLELVEPTLACLTGSENDVRRRIEGARIRRMKREIKRRLADGSQVDVFPRREVKGIAVAGMGDAERELLQKVGSYCSRTSREAEDTDDAEIVGFAMQIIKKRALSSRAALAATLDRRLEALRNEEAREEPPSKQELRDFQAGLPMDETTAERASRRIVASAVPADEKRRAYETRALNAIRRLLRKLPERDPKIEQLVTELRAIREADPSDKVIVFTEYRDTLEAILARLEGEPDLAGGSVVLCGGLGRSQRLNRQDLFERPETFLMLATDAASEGLNLQRSCRRVIHFELPWNPNRLEQRNGRVDRYGQTRPPVIRYLYYSDSPEESVLDLLVGKIERMADDRISTADVLGLLGDNSTIGSGLTRLDPCSPNIEAAKAELVRLFDDQTAEFVRTLHPLLAAGGPDGDQARILELLNTAEPLLVDDPELEQVVRDALGPGALTPDPVRQGVFRLDVPGWCQGPGIPAVYRAVTFLRSVAVQTPADEVEYLNAVHPLVQAMAADARRRLLQVYPAARGLPPRRLAALCVSRTEKPGIVFTFLGALQGGGGLLEERLIAVRVNLDGNAAATEQQAIDWLWAQGSRTTPQFEDIERLFGATFEQMRARAAEMAGVSAHERLTLLASRRREQARVLRADLDVDVADRLHEIDEQEKRARGLLEQTGQLRLFEEESGASGGFEARRAAVARYAARRREEIDELERIDPEPRLSPLGALLLVPAGESR